MKNIVHLQQISPVVALIVFLSNSTQTRKTWLVIKQAPLVLSLSLCFVPAVVVLPVIASSKAKFTCRCCCLEWGWSHSSSLFVSIVAEYCPSLPQARLNSLTVVVYLSQIVTYYLWWVLWYFKEFKNAKLDKWQKMLLSLRSNPQTMSPYIQESNGLCTSIDHHLTTTYCSTYGSAFVLK